MKKCLITPPFSWSQAYYCRRKFTMTLAMISPSSSLTRPLGWPLPFFETPWPSSWHWSPHLILGPSGPLLALSGPTHLSYLWGPLICLLRTSDDMGLKLGIEKVKDGAMPQSAVGNNNCYEWGRDGISRGSREPQGFLKLKKNGSWEAQR